MKRICSLLTAALFLTGGAMAFAQGPVTSGDPIIEQAERIEAVAPAIEDATDRNLKRLHDCIGGEWTDANGHRPVDMQLNTINGIRISDVVNFTGNPYSGSATMMILGNSGTTYSNVYWENVAGQRSITLGNLHLVPKSVDLRPAETAGGVYLDMTLYELEGKYGAGRILSAAETQALCGPAVESRYFSNVGMAVTFDPRSYTVDRIILIKGGSAAFDISVLNADSSLYRYAEVYGWNTEPRQGDVLNIGTGEAMNFKYYPQSVILQLSDLN